MVSTQLITEGDTELEVPELRKFRTSPHEYVPSLTRVFFNPLMEISRDIAVFAAQVMADDTSGLRVCDPLAGVGARALRYAKEVSGVNKVVANDRSSEAAELIRRNVKLNGLSNVEAREEDANKLLSSYRPRFHLIDLDPFGSPAPFVEAACSVLARNGMLALTATDTAPLCGAYPKACVRKYGAQPLRTEYCHELGLRILIGFCQRTAAKHDLALTPLLGYSAGRYFRAYLHADRGAKRTDRVLSEQGFISHCNSCGNRVVSEGVITELPSRCGCGSKFSHAGPMWIGRLVGKNFVGRLLADLARRNFKLRHRALELLNRCLEEADGPPAFHDLHKVAERASMSPPKLDNILSELRARGYFASRTHFSSTGFRTDAQSSLLTRLLSKGSV
ncbi:MAG: tRNA (guanine(10)-N(2))-dimethyltransferase [Candidatus Hadarchaeota archaeon]|nr:tRNA (guanine(10)-N(2))-dimethyltransferase [Candidatus Hadarchaeota archaeon]